VNANRSNVVRLIEHASCCVDGNRGLAEWAMEWLCEFERGRYGQLRAMVILVENEDGRIATISHSPHAMDLARHVGLLTIAANRKPRGDADISDMQS
jgi:hypothetical protein